MDLLEQCELDDEKLMGKSSRQRGPKVGESQRGVEGWGNQERGGGIRATCLKGPKRKCQKKNVSERKREGGDRQVGRCLELTPTESTQNVIEKNKGGGAGGWARKKRIRKRPKEKTQLPKGTAVRLSLSLPPCYLSFCRSPSLSLCHLHLYAPSISHDSTLLPPSPCFTHLPSPPHPLFFSPHTSTSIPHSRAKLAGTLKEYVRDSTGQLSATLEGP